MWVLTPDTPIISKSRLSWADLQKALRGVPLERWAPAFLGAEKTYGVNALLLTCVAALESAWGRSPMSVRTNNLFGFRAYDRNPSGAAVFPTYEKGILQVARYIRDFYATPGAIYYRGGTLRAMGQLWASDPNWTTKVCAVARVLRLRSKK